MSQNISHAASYTVLIAKTSPEMITAFVTSPAGARYGVTLSRALCSCSCPDAVYRQRPCKHLGHIVAELERAHRSVWNIPEQSDAARADLARAQAWVAVAEMAAPKQVSKAVSRKAA